MKEILAAIDKADKKHKTSSSDMKKFLSIITESTTNRLSVAEQMAVQHYQEPRKDITIPVLNKSKDAVPSMIGKYFKAVEQEIQEAADLSKNRARELAKRVVERVVPGQPAAPDINRLTGEPAVEPVPTASTGSVGPPGSNLKMTVLQQLKAGTYKGFAPKLSPEEIDAAIKYKQAAGEMNEAASAAQQAAIAISMKKAGKKPKHVKEHITDLKKLRDQLSEQIAALEEYYGAPPNDSKSPIPGRDRSECEDDLEEEKVKGTHGKACWKGYRRVGNNNCTKMVKK